MAAVIVICGLVRAGAADEWRELGKFERQTVQPVLDRLELRIEAHPEGKVIREIRVENLPVFSDEDGFLTALNAVHRTTRPHIIEREMVLAPGDPWDPERVAESIRNIRNPAFSSVVVILPIETDDPEAVDVLVVTRDVWSLRLNSDIQVQEDDVTFLRLMLAENNFLGWRKKVAAMFLMDQGTVEVGPSYRDLNIAGSHLVLKTRGTAIFSRETGDFEGTSSETLFEYPLWSLDSPWGFTVTLDHLDAITRDYLGDDVRTYDAPGTDEVEEVPWAYEHTRIHLRALATHQFGDNLKQQVSLGYELDWCAASVPGDVHLSPVVRRAFERNVLPRQETSSTLLMVWRMFTPTWVTLRDLNTYDLGEDLLVGPELTYTVGQALELIGSTDNYTLLEAQLSYAAAPGGDSYLRLTGSWAGRLEDSALIDQEAAGILFAATPRLFGALRIVGRAEVRGRFEDRENEFLTVGGATGLRGYQVGAFTGQRSVRTNLEFRTMPLAIWALRLGGVAFWDMGHAAADFDDLEMHHDVGFGMRLLIPQIDPWVFRVDWAFPLTNMEPWPGRVTLGFNQAF